jgi:hypothetical protein
MNTGTLQTLLFKQWRQKFADDARTPGDFLLHISQGEANDSSVDTEPAQWLYLPVFYALGLHEG